MPGLQVRGDGRVAARLRKGFQAADKVIRPEMVTVYAYKAAVREPG
jgi:molecular chaperone GrpE (heat shock protein)